MSTWMMATHSDGSWAAWRGGRNRTRSDSLPNLLAILILGLSGMAWWNSSGVLLWSTLPGAFWIAYSYPARLVSLLALTTPMFPVIRVTEDLVGAQQVSTKGLFFSADDPLIAAFALAWIFRRLGAGNRRFELFPGALIWLLALYPAVIAVNAFRLEPNQVLVSFLYYLKWGQYAILLFLIPQTVPIQATPDLMAGFRKTFLAALCASAAFAVYEVIEAVRTSSYTAAASFPRASSFFGTLDPARYGASEDPVNFGVFAMVGGSVALAFMGRLRLHEQWMTSMGVVAGFISLLLSASRAPWLAGIVAFGKIQKVGSIRLILGFASVGILMGTVYLVAPDLWSTTVGRFEAISAWQSASEGSAMDRVAIAMNSPVFTIDQYWLVGHGFSSYRFVAEEHLATITRGVTRSLYNFLLAVWYDGGAFGLVLWIVLFVQLNRRLGRIAAFCPWQHARALAWGLQGALWGLAMAAMFSEVFYSWRVMGTFYTATGVCLAADQYARRAARATQAEPRPHGCG